MNISRGATDGYQSGTVSARTARPWLAEKDAAEYLGVSPRTFRRYMAAGRIPARRLPSGRLRFRPEDVERLLTPVPTTGDVA